MKIRRDPEQFLGRFVVVDGIEGAGKTTHLPEICAVLEQAGKRVVVTREPGGTPLGEEIRHLLLTSRQGGMSREAETLLMWAARAEHLEKVIRPALAAGSWVVCDRFSEATYAYQGGGRGLPLERLAVLEEWVQGCLRPDWTLILDVPAAVGMARAACRRPADRFEQEDAAFFARARATYLARAAQHPARYRVVDADRPLLEVQAAVVQAVRDWLNQIDESRRNGHD